MFSNIGGKIKIWAVITCIIGMLFWCILGIVLMLEGDEMIIWGLLVALVGSVLAWIGTFLLYGFGQLIENSDKLVAINHEMLMNSNKLVSNSCISTSIAQAGAKANAPEEKKEETYTYTPINNAYYEAPRPNSRNLNLEVEVMGILNLWRAMGTISQTELDTFVERGGMKEIRAKQLNAGNDISVEGALMDIINEWRATGTIS